MARAADRLPFASSFETGDFSEWNGGLDASLLVTNQDASDGQYSARAEMVNGKTADNYKDYYFGDHAVVNGVPADKELWLQLDSKFDADFVFGTTQNLHKIAIINFEINSQRRYQLIINLHLPDEKYYIENLKWNADGSFNKTVNAYSQNVDTTVTMSRGQWDTIVLYFKLNTPAQQNGIIRLWVNNKLVTESTNAYMREDTTFNPNKLILSNYTGVRTDLSGYQRWDNFYLGEQPPPNFVRPKAPTMFEVR